MRLTWDEDKRRSNIDKHGLDFIDAETVFAGPLFTFEDKRRHYREQRLFIISMRKAKKHEQRLFFTELSY